MTPVFIQPGTLIENAYIESFNARVREELLDANVFRTIQQAQQTAETWRTSHNREHAHSALGGRTPEEFLALYETTAPHRIPWLHDEAHPKRCPLSVLVDQRRQIVVHLRDPQARVFNQYTAVRTAEENSKRAGYGTAVRTN